MMAIDLVIPMVFSQDPQWQARYAAASGNASAATKNVRFRSWGTEGLLIRCCMKFMPWLRRIHILLASESQRRYLDEAVGTNGKDGAVGPTINIVYHREFMPAKHLPCFNICTIEMFLHRIPGLAEHFIYSNDDFFPLSPLQPDDFFRPSEKIAGAFLPCQHLVERPYPSNTNIFNKFVQNGLNMIAADFGKQYTDTWLRGGHSMQPMLRTAVEEVCIRHADRISRSFTFDRTENNFNQYIFAFYQYLSGKYIDYEAHHAYVGPKVPTNEVEAYLRSPNPGIVCLNDNECIADWKQRAAIVRREIEARLEM